MIKPNWDIFRAKFSQNLQDNFEWFCYLMFCQEFDAPAGIFRYKNQSGIETDPVVQDDEVIGWQSKFYDTKLSDHKLDMMGMIDKSKRDYPDLTKILFYTNQEWGQGRSGGDSEVKRDVDQVAKDAGLELEWRTASFFEAPFVAVDNDFIARHFFVPDKSIFDLLDEKRVHSESVLLEIQTTIDFKDTKIEIDRSELLKQLLENLALKNILVISGVGGVGKTAVIKKLYAKLNGDIPFYVFKANEFNRDSMDGFFNEYSLTDFSTAHAKEVQKIIVVDSAEKLLDSTNTDPFKEFLAVLIQDGWKIIFTTRNNYLTDLNCDFIEIYKINPSNFDIHNLNSKELAGIAQANSFNLPEDTRLLELISNPFYLSEYLRFYTEEKIDYAGFKEKLWSRIIVKNNPEREQCFLATAFQRASDGQFFVTPDRDAHILEALIKDGIFGYEAAGYFITHDIYEEWALEKKIAVDYLRKANNNEFFELIGESLPIRRSLRNWISEQLLLQNPSVEQFIREIIQRGDIASFWQDELWISVLLSDHSDAFFVLFREELLGDDQELLKRLTFLLRLACKEVDYDTFKKLGLNNINILSMKYLLTKPKGGGWQSSISFIHDNIEKISCDNFYFVLPLIHEWNQQVKKGDTTRFASLIALKYYQSIVEKDVYLLQDSDKENLLQTILAGTSTIKDELEELFQEVLKNSWNNYGDPYFDLMEIILTKMEAAHPVCEILPEYVLQVADLFWYRPPQEGEYRYEHVDIDGEFCLGGTHLKYFPASPYKSPVFWLLKFSLQKTIDFILAFTNKTSECFANSAFATNEVREVEVTIGANQTINQYICDRLWCSFRGTQVSTYLLESVHMALEKFFLEVSPYMTSETLQDWLLYMLHRSRSASISAVVASIVQAFPEKTFNVAKVLFKTKEFFLYDTHRKVLDQTQKSSLTCMQNWSGGRNAVNEFHENDRIKACDDPHREMCLEHLAFRYQTFRSEGVSEEEIQERQQALWAIFDEYYSRLPDISRECDADKTWRLFLARMDLRKMEVEKNVYGEDEVFSLKPKIDPELKAYSEESIKKSQEYMHYMPLKLWADSRRDGDERCKQYEQYENSPQLALEETKAIVEILKQGASERVVFFIHGVPPSVCSTLIMDFFNQLTEEDREFCCEVILEYATFPLKTGYHYQISDGTDSAIAALPILFRHYPQVRSDVKMTLLLNLFDDYTRGMRSHVRYATFSIKAIHKLWEDCFSDAQSILLGFLLLKPKHDILRGRLRQKAFKRKEYETDDKQLSEEFLKENDCDFGKVLDNTISIDDLDNLEQIESYILDIGFKLIPVTTRDPVHKELILSITEVFAVRLLSLDRKDRVDPSIVHSFMEHFSHVVLNASEQDLTDYLKPFLDGFNGSEGIAELFKEFISTEDKLNTYDRFWQVWDLFYEKVVFLCRDGDGVWYADRVVKCYLFAGNSWIDTADGWHSFKDLNSRLFADISKDIGHCPSSLCALASSLNGIAGQYCNSGIKWISEMLTCHQNLWTAKLETNTLYYLESLVRKYVYKERENIRRTKQLKEELLVILEFLVEKGSVVGYMLRENIL